jgi:hypothetical protein
VVRSTALATAAADFDSPTAEPARVGIVDWRAAADDEHGAKPSQDDLANGGFLHVIEFQYIP